MMIALSIAFYAASWLVIRAAKARMKTAKTGTGAEALAVVLAMGVALFIVATGLAVLAAFEALA